MECSLVRVLVHVQYAVPFADDLQPCQTAPQKNIRLCFLVYWTPLFQSVRPMGTVLDSHFRSPVQSDTDQRIVWEPCAHLARTQYALWRQPEALWRQPEAPRGILQDVLRELSMSYVTPSCGESCSLGHSIRSARGSTVLRCSGRATLSLPDRERCRKGYDLHALSRLLGERDRMGRGGGPMGLTLLSDRSTTPPFPSASTTPSPPSRPT